MFTSGCSVFKPREAISSPPTSWQAHQHLVSKISAWSIEGRIGVKKANESFSASFNWSQQNNAFHIEIIGPIGQGYVSITGHPDEILISTTDESVITTEPEKWLKTQLNLNIPLRHLANWIKGIPQPTERINALETFKNGTLRTLEQSGWTIDFAQYHTDTKPMLPKKLSASADNTNIKIKVHEWVTGDTAP